MLSRVEIEKLVQKMYEMHPFMDSELARSGHGAIVGVSEERSFQSIVAYYNISTKNCEYWFDFFGFLKDQSSKVKRRHGQTQQEIKTFLAENEGSILSIPQIADGCNVSLPTIYNFKKDNPGWFKKESRGNYQIFDDDKMRAEAKGYK